MKKYKIGDVVILDSYDSNYNDYFDVNDQIHGSYPNDQDNVGTIVDIAYDNGQQVEYLIRIKGKPSNEYKTHRLYQKNTLVLAYYAKHVLRKVYNYNDVTYEESL